mmetsp:Transcript_11146/g.25798  ORF Transcript_11146/g.25798 Transcript_11146/m.25798 type:complete len:93 (+) Transcript_11146:26-304(+)
MRCDATQFLLVVVTLCYAMQERRQAQLKAQKLQGYMMLAIAVVGFLYAQRKYPDVSFFQLGPIASTAAPGIVGLFGTIAALTMLTRLLGFNR